MGMFDRVWVTCPQCDENVEFQSKAGICELENYDHTSVPPCIAESLYYKSEFCKQCGFEIKFHKPILQNVTMIIKTGDEDEDD